MIMKAKKAMDLRPENDEEAMKATKKKAKTEKYLRLDDYKESQEGYDKEAKKATIRSQDGEDLRLKIRRKLRRRST